MTLYGNYFLKIISQNPYRILGTTGNAPKKDIIANVNKYKAFLKVGKTVSGDFDALSGTDQIDRTIESLAYAEKAIELPIDQLRWTLFWFVNVSSIDRIALNHVQSGNVGKAIEIWLKVETASSLLNIVVSELIQQNWGNAVLYADKLFSNYAKSICSLVDETLNLSPKQLMLLFMNTIAEDNYDVLKAMYRSFPLCHSFNELLSDSECRFLIKAEDDDLTKGIHYPCVKVKKGGSTAYYTFSDGENMTEEEFNSTKDSLTFVCSPFDSAYKSHRIYKSEDVCIPSKLWNNCICETLVIPFIEQAKEKIATYKAIPKEQTEERYKYAKNVLINSLNEVYSYLGGDNTDYQALNNQIVKEALQCAIDCYNSSQDTDYIAREIKEFVWLITTLATPGSVLRQRCKENYDTLCNICSKLPPESVMYYHRLLKEVIEKYRDEASTIQNASAFVQKCYPYLMSIKSVLGSSHTYYLKMCTRVAEDALEDIITDYNEKSESLHKRLEKASSTNRSNIIKLIQEMMKSAVITMYHLKMLGLDSDFRQNRFDKNYDIITVQARNARVLGANGLLAILGGEVSEEDFNNDLKKHAPDFRNEEGYYSSISNLQDCYTLENPV